MQRSLSFYLSSDPDGSTNCQQDRQNGCAPRSDEQDHHSSRAPYGAGEQKQNRIEDDDEDDDQKVSQQDRTPMHMWEMGFHSHTSCLIELVGGGQSALLAEISATPTSYLYREDAQQAPIWGMKWSCDFHHILELPHIFDDQK